MPKGVIKHKHQKNYRLRASRGSTGRLVEHKKDYRRRAAVTHERKKQKQKLLEAAFFRNPDEFDRRMVKDMKPHKGATTTELKTAVSEDLAHYLMHKGVELKKIDRLKQDLHFIGAEEPKRKHIIFVETEEEAENFDPVEYFHTTPEFVNRAYNRPKIEDLEKGSIFVGKQEPTASDLKKIAKQTERSYKELAQRESREAVIGKIIDKMTTEKNLLSKDKKIAKTIRLPDGTTQTVWKWQPIRKK